MSRVSPAHIALAQTVFAHESGHASSDVARTVGRVYAALFGALVPIIGAAGADAVFARSVKLARTQSPDLAEMLAPPAQSGTDAAVTAYVETCLGQLEPGAAAYAGERLLAVLLALLTSFIGEALVWQIVQNAFPGIPSQQSKESE